MFGYKLIKESELEKQKMNYDLLTNAYMVVCETNNDARNRIDRLRGSNIELQFYIDDTNALLCDYVEALEQQTKDKQELQAVLDSYRKRMLLGCGLDA